MSAGWHISEAAYQRWIRDIETPAKVRLEAFDGPLISIILTTFDTPPELLREALDSVLQQSYHNWQLCIVDDCSSDESVRRILAEYSSRDERIDIACRQVNGGIAVAANDALGLARGDYVALMDHDDLLAEHALLSVAHATRQQPQARLLYSDSDHLDAGGRRCRPYFKPAWNYRFFLGQNYLNHLTIYKRALLSELQGFRQGLDGSQDYDLALRAIEQLSAEEIVHLPGVLYHWRDVETSVSRSNLAQAVAMARKAVQQHLQRTHQQGKVGAARNAIVYNRVEWVLPEPAPAVWILVHDESPPRAGLAAERLLANSPYPRLHVEPVSGEEIPAQINRRVASATGAGLVCLIQADFVPAADNWLEDMAATASGEGVGCVGPQYKTPEGLLSGPALLRQTESDALEIFTEISNGNDDLKGYYACLALDRTVSVLQGGVIMFSRQRFLELGGLDTQFSSWDYLTADLSLSFVNAGLQNIWSAHPQFSSSPQSAAAETIAGEDRGYFTDKWREKLPVDGNFSADLSVSRGYEASTPG